MYRIFVVAIICMACNSSDKRGLQPASMGLLPFFKNEVNPLLQNRETTAAKRKLDSILPVVKKRYNYVEMCSWLRCMAVVYQLENKPDSARQYVDQSLQLAIEKDTTERQILAGKIQTADIMADQYSLDSALRYALEAHFLAKRIDTPGLPFICMKLYDIYEKIGDLPMQKKYLFEGFMRSTSPKHKTVFATKISAYYDRVNQIDSALIFFQALMKDSSFSNPYYDAVRYENLGALLTKKGFLKEGLHYQLKGMQISRALGELDALSYYNVAATYRKLGQYNEDANLLDTALSFVAHEKKPALQKQIWRAKAENLTLQKKTLQAYAALDSAFAYYQKEVETSIIIRATELEKQYSLLEKDNQIKSLALSHQVSENARARQRLAIVFIIGGAVILGLLLGWKWKRKYYKMVIKELNSRHQLLRGQSDHHFWGNCVGVLQAIIRQGDTGRAVWFVQQFVRLLRLSLENTRHPFVPLNKELEALTCYLQLQQNIFIDRFDYRIDVVDVPEQEEILMPPMLLQPFAENAIMHGFAGQQEKGQINIRIQKDDKALHCVIEDNGRGFQGAETNLYRNRPPLSTLITQERLAILSRQTKTVARLRVVDKKAEEGKRGVRVELILPYQMED